MGKKVHQQIVHDVYNFIIANQGNFFHTEDLCYQFWGDFNSGLERQMRSIIEEIVNDRGGFDKIIASSYHGYFHPLPTKKQMMLAYKSVQSTQKSARSDFYRAGSLLYRMKLDNQYRFLFVDEETDVYEAFARENDEQMERELDSMPDKVYREPIKKDIEEQENGQFALNLN